MTEIVGADRPARPARHQPSRSRAINTVNLYLASSNLESFFSLVLRINLPRSFWLVVSCVIGYLLMLTNIFRYDRIPMGSASR